MSDMTNWNKNTKSLVECDEGPLEQRLVRQTSAGTCWQCRRAHEVEHVYGISERWCCVFSIDSHWKRKQSFCRMAGTWCASCQELGSCGRDVTYQRQSFRFLSPQAEEGSDVTSALTQANNLEELNKTSEGNLTNEWGELSSMKEKPS